MSVYQWKGAGYGLSTLGARTVLEKIIDVPYLIAQSDQSGLALVAAPNTGVALAATGFAADDILEIFWVPEGTVIKKVGHYVITAEGAVATINAGVTSNTETNTGTDIDGFGVFDNNGTAGTLDCTDSSDAFGSTYLDKVLYITDGSVDIEFNHATDTAVFKVTASFDWVGDLDSPY